MKKKLLSGLVACIYTSTSYSQITINEIDSNTPGTDTLEFIELYDGGAGGTALDGLVLVLVAGSDNLSYDAYDLDGFTTDENGYFVIGNISVADTQFAGSSNQLQNDAEAVALYMGDATSFPNNTVVTTTDLIDAIVYGDGSGNDSELLAIFGGEQQDENLNGDDENESIQRNPDGATAFITSTPTPGVSNDQDPTITLILDTDSISEGDGEGAIFVEVEVLEPVVGDLTLSIDISDNTELSGPTSVTISDGDDFTFFELDAVNDAIVDGVQAVDITVSAPGFQDGVAIAIVADDDLVLPEVVINEMQVKASGDDPQYVELYNNGASSVDLAGWSVRAFESDSESANFGGELGSFIIPADSPVLLGSEDFYLVGDSIFESIYGIIPDLQAEPGFGTFDITMILFDADGNAVYTVFSTDGDEDNQANNAGGAAVADVTIGPDAGNSPAGFILDEDGDNSASIFAFSIFPDSLATPGTTNVEFIPRLRVEIDNTLLAEDAGTGAATATITRINETSGALTVTVESLDPSEITVQATTVSFADGEETQTVALDVVDDTDEDDTQEVTVTASATGFAGGFAIVSVADNDVPLLNVCDIAFIAAVVDNPDFFAFVTLVDLQGEVQINFTDNGWLAAGGFRANEGTLVWTAPSEGVAAGTVVSFVDNTSDIGTVTGAGPVLSGDGDQLFAYQGFESDPSLIAGISMNGDWDADATSSNTSALPAVLDPDGAVAIAPEVDNAVYSGITTGTVAQLKAAIADPANYTIGNARGDVEPITLPASFTIGEASDYEVTIADCSVSNGQFVINFTATGPSDIYVTSDLENYTLATNGAGVASGTYTDNSPLAVRAFYLIQEAGTPAP